MLHMKSDVVVIGGGPGGMTTALALKRRRPNATVTLIEKRELGGANVLSASLPTKTLLHLAKQHIANQTSVKPDSVLSEVRARTDEMMADYDEVELQKTGIDVLKGDPVFHGRRTVVINDTKIKFKFAVIATGSSAKRESIKGLNEDYLIDVEQLLMLKKLPKNLLVVGTGRTGIEIAQSMSMLGVKTVIINEHDTLLPYLNKEVRIVLQDGLRAQGLRVFHGARIGKVHGDHAEIHHLGGATTVQFDKVLCATGREPVLPEGLKKAHVKVKPIGIPTNLKHQTRNHRIFAIGDVASRSHFTHIAVDQAYDVVEYICSWRSRFRHRPAPLVPATLYTAPEVATVGLSYKEARQAHRKRSLRKVVVPYWRNDRAKTEFSGDGALTVVVKKRTGQIIGAQVAGNSANELISTFCIAMQHNISLPELATTLFPYPTYHELIQTAAEQFYAES